MISVIIPAYNAEKTIGQSLKSILQQHTATEIILADDGSTDSTLEAAKKYSGHVRILTLNHGGVSKARNAGLAEAQGEWVMFLDADDMLLPDALEKLAPYMTEDVDAICGTICRGNENHKGRGKVLTFPAGHDLMDFVLADPTNYLTVHAWVFRRRGEMPQFDPELCIGEDSDWVLQYLSDCTGKAVFVPVPVYRYTISADSTVHQWRQGQEQDFLKMMTKLSRTPAGEEKNWSLFVLTNYLLILTHVIFHPGNRESLLRQFNTARILRSSTMFSDAFKKAKLSELNQAKHIVLGCLKYRLILLGWIAVKTRQWRNRNKLAIFDATLSAQNTDTI